MYFWLFLSHVIAMLIVGFLLNSKLKTLLNELYEGRLRRLEMEVEEIEHRITNKSNN